MRFSEEKQFVVRYIGKMVLTDYFLIPGNPKATSKFGEAQQ